MNIADLREGMNNVELTARVAELGEVRQVQTRFGPNQVSDNIIEDDSGKQVKLTLWGDDIKKIHVGDNVSITGGYVKSWKGELQVGVSRSGSLTIGGAAPAGTAGLAGTATEPAAEPPAPEPSGTEPAAEPSGAEPEPAAEAPEPEPSATDAESAVTEETIDEAETSTEPADEQIAPPEKEAEGQ